jgi:single-strand DNA-binding protein
MAYVHLQGTIGREPDVQTVGDRLCCSFPVADRAPLRSREPGKAPPTQWYQVELWGPQAEALRPLLTKGTEVMAHGQLELVRFPRPDGTEGYQPTVLRATVQVVGQRTAQPGAEGLS